MKVLQLCLVSLTALAAAQCTSEQYFSPNFETCTSKKTEGQYCNAVQTCVAGTGCRNMECFAGASARGYPSLPSMVTPSAATQAAWPSHNLGLETNIIKTECATYGTPEQCMWMSIETNDPPKLPFKLAMGMYEKPAYLFPDGSIREYTSEAIEHNYSSYFSGYGLEEFWSKPFNGQVFKNEDHSAAYDNELNWPVGTTSLTSNIFEKEVFGQMYQVDPATGLADHSKPNIILSYAVVIAEDDTHVSGSPPVGLPDLPGPACFTPTTDTLCPNRLTWKAGAAKFTKSLIDSQPEAYPLGTKYRFVEILDFTGTDDMIWAGSTINGHTYFTELEEDVAYPIDQLRVPMNLVNQYDKVGSDTFHLDFKDQATTIQGTPWGMTNAQDVEHEITIRGKQVLIASYEEIGARPTGMYFYSNGLQQLGAALYEVRMYPSVVPVDPFYETPLQAAATTRTDSADFASGLNRMGSFFKNFKN